MNVKKNVSVRGKSKTNEPRVDRFGTCDTAADAGSTMIQKVKVTQL